MTPLASLVDPTLVERLGWTLVHSTWQGAIIAAVAAVLLHALRAARPQLRYLLACVSLASMVATAVVTFAVIRPSYRAGATIGAGSGIDRASTQWTLLETQASGTAPVSGVTTRTAATSEARPDARPDASLDRAASAAAAGTAAASRANANAPTVGIFEPGAWRRMTLMIERLLPQFVALWIAGLLICSIRLLGALALVEHLKRHQTHPMPHEWQQRVVALARRMRVRGAQAITVRASIEARTAAVIGWLRPVILVPASALAGLTTQQLEAVLAHELAHIRRHDYLVNLLQSLAETLFFYHPAVWFISRAIRTEREHCCDDEAVAVVGDAVAYAGALTDLELLRQGTPALAMAANGGSLLRRIQRLLAPSTDTAPSWSTATSLLGLAVAVFAIASVRGSIAASLQPGSTPTPAATTAQPSDSRETPRATTTRPSRDQRTPRAARAESYWDVQPPEPPEPPAPPAMFQPPTPPPPVPAMWTEPPDPPQPPQPGQWTQPPQPAQPVQWTQPPQPPQPPQPAQWTQPPQPPDPLELDDEPVPPAPPAPPAPFAAPAPAAPPAVGVPPAPFASPATAAPPAPHVPMAPPAPGVGPYAPFAAPAPAAPRAPHAPAATPAPPAPPAPRSWYDDPIEFARSFAATPRPTTWPSPAPTARVYASTATLPPAAPAPIPRLTAMTPIAARPAAAQTPAPTPPPPPQVGGLERAKRWLESWFDGDGANNWTWQENGHRFQVRSRGSFDITDDDLDIKSVTPGGYVTLEERLDGITSRVEVSNPDGKLARAFYRNGQSLAWEPEGRAWLAKKIPDLVRRTGFGAEGRVRRILARGGPTAVLDEVTIIQSSYVKRLYMERLLAETTLQGPMLTRLLTQAGKEITSDYERATLLIKVAKSGQMTTDEQRLAYAVATQTIKSGYEHRRALDPFVQGGPLSEIVLKSVLDSAARIESDYELATLLIPIGKAQPLTTGSMDAYVLAAQTIDSDYELRRALTPLITQPAPVPPAVLGTVFRSATGIDSDYELATLLVELVNRQKIDDANKAPFFNAVDTIQSDYERGRVLKATVARGAIGDALALGVIESTHHMNSAYEAANVLKGVAASQPLEGPLRKAYITAAERLSSAHERDSVLVMLVRSEARTR